MTSNRTCPVCQKTPFTSYPLGRKDGFDFVGCQNCGSALINPMLSQEQLDAFYAEAKPTAKPLPNPDGEISAMRRKIGKAVDNGTGRSFLDVGCRQGYAVLAARQAGFSAKGIDSHRFYVDFCGTTHNAPDLFEHATAASYAEKGTHVNFIFCLEQLCEQADPDSFIAALSKMLAPGGKIYMEEPNGNSFWTPRKFSNWRFPSPPVNFIYPSRQGVEILLKRHGLKIERAFFAWGAVMRLLIVKT